MMEQGSSADIDPRCPSCGRPVIGGGIWGSQGPYHPECTRGPGYREEPLVGAPWMLLDPRVDDLLRRLSELEKKRPSRDTHTLYGHPMRIENFLPMAKACADGKEPTDFFNFAELVRTIESMIAKEKK